MWTALRAGLGSWSGSNLILMHQPSLLYHNRSCGLVKVCWWQPPRPHSLNMHSCIQVWSDVPAAPAGWCQPFPWSISHHRLKCQCERHRATRTRLRNTLFLLSSRRAVQSVRQREFSFHAVLPVAPCKFFAWLQFQLPKKIICG